MSIHTIQYVARTAAEDYLRAKSDINVKLAEMSDRLGLNPHQIQRSVELANHIVHGSLRKMAEAASGDRNINFEIADFTKVMAHIGRPEMAKTASSDVDPFGTPDASWREPAARPMEKAAAAPEAAGWPSWPFRASSQPAGTRRSASRQIMQDDLNKVAKAHVAAADFEQQVMLESIAKEAAKHLRAGGSYELFRGAVISERPDREVARCMAKVASVLHRRGLLSQEDLVKTASLDEELFDMDLPEGYRVNPEWKVLKMVDQMLNAVKAGELGACGHAGPPPRRIQTSRVVGG